jgi:phosphoribosylformimino-5-aminoimidazole carboxamide ribotide isomerase
MQIIPVFDIKDGILVHAIGGARQDYRPIQTALIPGSEPAEATAILVRLGFRRIYMADLNAITKCGDNFGVVRDLVRRFAVEVWLDAGLSGAEKIPLREVPQISLIAGSETLVGLDSLSRICETVGIDRVIFSLDTKNGEVLTPDPSLKSAAPGDLAAEAFARGIQKMIVLDLKAVGSRAGLNKELLHCLVRRFPGKSIFPGGGLTAEDISELKRMNLPGVLTATALYARQIPALPEI